MLEPFKAYTYTLYSIPFALACWVQISSSLPIPIALSATLFACREFKFQSTCKYAIFFQA